MATRDYLKHTVSTSEPTGSTLGDEWYNPSTNKIYKRLAVNGTQVEFREQPNALTIQSSGSTVVQSASIINFNGYSLSVDSTGAVNIAVPTAGAAGSNGQIQFNNLGSLGATSNLTWNNATQTLGLTGFLTTFALSRSGNINTATTWTTTSPIFNSAAALITDQSGTGGTIAIKAGHSLLSPNFASSSAQTITNAANLYVNGSVASTNTSITNNWAIYNDGNMRVTGTLFADGNATIVGNLTLGTSAQNIFQITSTGIPLQRMTSTGNTRGAIQFQSTSTVWASIAANTVLGELTSIDSGVSMRGGVFLVKENLADGQAAIALVPSGSGYSSVANSSMFVRAPAASTSTSTGTVVINNGVGISGNIFAAEHHTATGYTNRPNTGYDITGNYIHAQSGVNIGRAAGGSLTFGDGNTPSMIVGTPTTLRAYLNNNAASNQVFYASGTGLLAVGLHTTPQYRLDVNNAVTGSNSFQASFGSTISAGLWTGIHFGYSEAANQLYRKSAIVFERQDSSARGKVHILNNGANSSASATLADAKLTITFDGNVGIGQTNPVAKFEVSGTSGQLFSVTDSMTGTIFSVNDVSGIPSIEVLDTGVVKVAEYGGFIAYGVNNAVSAAGTTQATATAITKPISNVTTVAANSGVVLPSATPGMRVIIRNGSAITLRIYPAVGAQINSLGTNISFSLDTLATLEFIAFSTTQWYTVNATFA